MLEFCSHFEDDEPPGKTEHLHQSISAEESFLAGKLFW